MHTNADNLDIMLIMKNLKTVTLWILHLAFVPWTCSENCPTSENLSPHCWCFSTNDGGSLICKNILDPLELTAPVEATIGFKMAGISILNSTLRYLPHDLFIDTTFEKVQFIDTFLMALSDGDLAFEGLEDHLVEIRASATSYISQWDLSQLRNLKKMNLIDIHSITIETMTEDLPEFPELSAFGITNANLSYLSDRAFAKCPHITIVALNNNELTSLKRSMFPNPAENLSLINLQNNKLSTLPKDFFTNMPALSDVFLEENQFQTLDELVFSDVLGRVGSLNLQNNPITCDCRLVWLIGKKMPVEFAAFCRKPDALEGCTLKYLDARDLRC